MRTGLPVTAIFYEGELPAEWHAYGRIEREFFELADVRSRLGGGAAGAGPFALDHPELANVAVAG